MTHLMRDLSDTRTLCGRSLDLEVMSVTTEYRRCDCLTCCSAYTFDLEWEVNKIQFSAIQFSAEEKKLLKIVLEDFRDGISCIDPEHDAKREAVNIILKKIKGSS